LRKDHNNVSFLFYFVLNYQNMCFCWGWAWARVKKPTKVETWFLTRLEVIHLFMCHRYVQAIGNRSDFLSGLFYASHCNSLSKLAIISSNYFVESLETLPKISHNLFLGWW